jgi:hypothetical protein
MLNYKQNSREKMSLFYVFTGTKFAFFYLPDRENLTLLLNTAFHFEANVTQLQDKLLEYIIA